MKQDQKAEQMKISQKICYTSDFVHKALAHRHTTRLGRVLMGSKEGNQATRRRIRSWDGAGAFRGSVRARVHPSVCLSVCMPADSSLLLLRHCNLMQTVSYIEKLH